jgi:hypothetical protein
MNTRYKSQVFAASFGFVDLTASSCHFAVFITYLSFFKVQHFMLPCTKSDFTHPRNTLTNDK